MKKTLTLLSLAMLLPALCSMAAETGKEIDPETGLVIAPGYELVKNNCTVCHSAMLVTQNKASREGWLEMIRWMQKTQGLWPLETETEKAILDYLAENYGPSESFRREPLDIRFPDESGT